MRRVTADRLVELRGSYRQCAVGLEVLDECLIRGVKGSAQRVELRAQRHLCDLALAIRGAHRLLLVEGADSSCRPTVALPPDGLIRPAGRTGLNTRTPPRDRSGVHGKMIQLDQ